MPRMTGQVAFAAPALGRFAVRFAEGFAVIELLEAEPIEVGDLIEGELDAMGGQDFFNTSKGCILDARILALALDEAGARRMLA